MKEWTSVGYILKGVRRQLGIPRTSIFERLHILPETLRRLESEDCTLPIRNAMLSAWLDLLSITDKEWYLFHNYRWEIYRLLDKHHQNSSAKYLATLLAAVYMRPSQGMFLLESNDILTKLLSIIPNEPGTVAKSIYINEEEDERCRRKPKK